MKTLKKITLHTGTAAISYIFTSGAAELTAKGSAEKVNTEACGQAKAMNE